MYWYITCLKKYAVFSGRARGREHWIFNLFNIALVLLLVSVDRLLDLAGGWTSTTAGVYALLTIMPGTAVAVRRLHDTGRSGWWLLVSLVPFAGPFLSVYFLAKAGQFGANQYGPDPREGEYRGRG